MTPSKPKSINKAKYLSSERKQTKKSPEDIIPVEVGNFKLLILSPYFQNPIRIY